MCINCSFVEPSTLQISGYWVLFMLLLVLCWCETNMDTVLRFVKLASSFHILHCFNELCNVTIQFCMFTRSSLKNVTVKKPWDVDNVKVWLLQVFWTQEGVVKKLLIVKKYCKLIKKCSDKGDKIYINAGGCHK